MKENLSNEERNLIEDMRKEYTCQECGETVTVANAYSFGMECGVFFIMCQECHVEAK